MAAQTSTLKSAMGHIVEAQNLDSQSYLKEAYVRYLQSIQMIIQHLLSAALDPAGFTCDSSTKKMLNLVTMCVQRSEDIADKKMGTGANTLIPSHGSNRPPSSVHLSHPTSPSEVGSVSMPVMGTPSAVSGSSGSHSLPSMAGDSRANSNVIYRDMNPDLRSPHEPSPLEIAERQNRQLMAAYRARIAALGKKSFKATDMSLGLQRRLAENLALAQAREKALAKKRAERRRRLEEITARRFTSTIGMSEDEMERRQIYTRILEFEQDNVWLGPWREKLREKAEDCLLIQQLIAQIVKATSHPLTQLLYQYQHRIYNKIQPLLVQWQNAVTRSNQGQKVTSQSPDQLETKSEVGLAEKASRVGSQSSLGSSKQFSPADYDISNFDDLYDYGSKPSSPDVKDEKPSYSEVNSNTKSHGDDSGSVVRDGQLPDSVQNCSPASDSSSQTADKTSPNCVSPDVTAIHWTEGSPDDLSSSLSLLELEREALMRHLGDIVRDVQDLLEKLTSMFIVAYEQLDSATGRDACYSSLEEPFYRSIWGHILSLFRVINYKDEQSIAQSMSKHRDCDPASLKIPRHFCLLPEDSLLMPEGYCPYSAPIQELRTLAHMVSPLVKLECIVQVSRSICKCVEDFYKSNETDAPNIGADDLLPIMSYVVIKANLPQIVAECQALEELVHEGYLMGEEGYCLTSLETAVRYVTTLA